MMDGARSSVVVRDPVCPSDVYESPRASRLTTETTGSDLLDVENLSTVYAYAYIPIAYVVGQWTPLDSGGSGILSLAGNRISLNLRRQERNFRNPLETPSPCMILYRTSTVLHLE